jgi:putative transcriptional regulator
MMSTSTTQHLRFPIRTVRLSDRSGATRSKTVTYFSDAQTRIELDSLWWVLRFGMGGFGSFLPEGRVGMSEENLVRAKLYPDGRLVEEMPDGTERPIEPRTDWDRFDSMTEEEIEANALSEAEWTEEDFANSRRVPSAQQIRRKLGMTQVEFSETFDIPLGTLRDWEQLPIVPDRAAGNFLIVIERFPQEVIEALAAYRPGWRATAEVKKKRPAKLAS